MATHERPTSGGYIQSWAAVPEAAYQYIEGLLDGYHEQTRRFYCHVLNSSTLWTYRNGWVPVAQPLIHKELRKAEGELEKLVQAGLLERKDHSRGSHRSREWRIPSDIFYTFTTCCHTHVNGSRVNLFNGRTTIKREKHVLNDENNHPHPELLREAMRHIPFGRFNKAAVEKHLASLKQKADHERVNLDRVQSHYGKESDEYTLATQAARSLFSAYSNDFHCYRALLQQHPQDLGGGIYQFHMAYRPQRYGRISHIGGGLQSCSRAMKKAAYTGIRNVFNYDIESSQVYILIDLLEQDGFDASWPKTYLSTPNNKNVYAATVGLPVDTWKECLYAVFFGATVPINIEKSEGELRAILEAAANTQGVDLLTLYASFQALIQPLYEVLQKWRSYLEKSWLPANTYSGRGGQYVKGDTGSRLNVSELMKARHHKRRASLAALRLQGKEAAFIHHLTTLSKPYGYTVIANEHDGLVTIGEIPKETIDKVRRTLSMPYIKLTDKPFG